MKINVTQAQLLLLSFRKSEEIVETYETFKKLYKRAALKASQRAIGTGDKDLMQKINASWEVLAKVLENGNTLKMPSDIEPDVAQAPKDINPLYYADVPSFLSRDTLVRKAFSIMNADVLFDFANKCESTIYIENHNLQVWQTRGYLGQLSFRDLTGAFQSKALCETYNVRCAGCLIDNYTGDQYREAMMCHNISNFFRRKTGDDKIKDVWAFLVALDGFDERGCLYFNFENTKIEIQKSVDKGSKVFSPLHLDRVKAIKELPAKPNRTHMWKMLVNGQFSHLRQDYYYNPDYSYSPDNYGEEEGFGVNPFEYAQNLFTGRESVSFGDGNAAATIRSGCNDWSTVRLKVENRFLKEDVEMNEVAGLIA